MKKGTLLDTAFLITLVNPARPNHSVAKSYFRHALEQGIRLFLPTLVMAEFAVKQPLSDLILSNFIPAPFNVGDASLAGKLIHERSPIDGEARDGAKVDLFILAQAHRLEVPSILSEDRQTLQKHCDNFRGRGILNCHVVLMEDGFVAARILDPTTRDLF